MIQFRLNTDPLQREGHMKLKLLCTLFGLSFLIIAQDADAFSFSIFANRLPISEDAVILLLGAGIVGFIALGRRKVKRKVKK
jgi:hypothetical protein